MFLDWFDTQALDTEPDSLLVPSDSYWTAIIGVPTGGLFSGAFGVKSDAQEDAFGGDAGDEYDPCYHQACDRLENTDPVLYEELTRAGAHVIEALAWRDEQILPIRDILPGQFPTDRKSPYREKADGEHLLPMGAMDEIASAAVSMLS